MRHSLHAHIIYLENKVQSLRDRLTSTGITPAEIQDIEQQLSVAELALQHYREAYALELSVSGSEPPDRPGAQQGDGSTGNPESSKSKKDPLAAICARARKRARAVLHPALSPLRHNASTHLQ